MQQTSKYQFNLVDATDDFSPDPLNQNAQKTETALAEMEADLADLVTEVGAGGHTCRIAFGSYQGSGTYGAGSPNSLSFDFYPVLVMLQGVGMQNNGIMVRGSGMGTSTWSSGGSPVAAAWTNHSVSWYSTESDAFQNNMSNFTYFYVAVGYTQ